MYYRQMKQNLIYYVANLVSSFSDIYYGIALEVGE